MTRPWIKRLLEYNTEEFKTLLSSGTWTIQILWYPTWFTQVTGIIWLGWTITLTHQFDHRGFQNVLRRWSSKYPLSLGCDDPTSSWIVTTFPFEIPQTIYLLCPYIAQIILTSRFPRWNPNVLHLKSIFSGEITIKKKTDGKLTIAPCTPSQPTGAPASTRRCGSLPYSRCHPDSRRTERVAPPRPSRRCRPRREHCQGSGHGKRWDMVGYHEKKHGNTWEKWKTLEKHMIFGLGKDTKRSYQGEFEESMGLEWDTIVSSGTSRGGTKSPNQRGAQ